MARRTPSVTPSPEAFSTEAAGPQAAPAAAPPDAILFPAAMKRGRTSVDRLGHIQRTFGPKLGGDQHTSLGPQHGGRVYSRDVGGGWYLTSLSPDDSLLFGKDHDLAGQDRYRWEDQPDGSKHGWLVDEDEASTTDALPDVTAARAAQQAEQRWREAVRPDEFARLSKLREKFRSAADFTPDEFEEMRRLTREVYGDAEDAETP